MDYTLLSQESCGGETRSEDASNLAVLIHISLGDYCELLLANIVKIRLYEDILVPSSLAIYIFEVISAN